MNTSEVLHILQQLEGVEQAMTPKIQRTWHDDPRIQEALRERPSEDVAVLECPQCGLKGYYGCDSHFTCLACNRTWQYGSEDEPIDPSDFLTVYDLIEAECADSYSGGS